MCSVSFKDGTAVLHAVSCLRYAALPSGVSGCIGYASSRARRAVLSASVAGAWGCEGILAIGGGLFWLNRFPRPPPEPPKVLVFAAGLARFGTGCEINVFRNWVRIAAVGDATTTCVRLRSLKISSHMLAFSSTFSLCFLTPSLMCPISTAFIAAQNVSQLVWFSGTFSHMTSGSSSRTVHSELVPFSILARHARLIAFSANATCDQTSWHPYFSFYPKSSTRSLSPTNSLSSSTTVFFALSIVGNLVKNASSKSVHFVSIFPSSSYHSSAGKSDPR